MVRLGVGAFQARGRACRRRAIARGPDEGPCGWSCEAGRSWGCSLSFPEDVAGSIPFPNGVLQGREESLYRGRGPSSLRACRHRQRAKFRTPHWPPHKRHLRRRGSGSYRGWRGRVGREDLHRRRGGREPRWGFRSPSASIDRRQARSTYRGHSVVRTAFACRESARSFLCGHRGSRSPSVATEYGGRGPHRVLRRLERPAVCSSSSWPLTSWRSRSLGSGSSWSSRRSSPGVNKWRWIASRLALFSGAMRVVPSWDKAARRLSSSASD